MWPIEEHGAREDHYIASAYKRFGNSLRNAESGENPIVCRHLTKSWTNLTPSLFPAARGLFQALQASSH